jgi:hypothetical protein
MLEFIDLMNDDYWVFEKNYSNCEVLRFKNDRNLPAYRIDTVFDFPPELVFDYMKIIDKRKTWDGSFDEVNIVKEYKMNTQLVYAKLKSQWPMGNREILLCFQAIFAGPGTFYLAGKSVEHDEFPVTNKMIRIFTTQGSYYFTPLTNGKQTKLIYITEVFYRYTFINCLV